MDPRGVSHRHRWNQRGYRGATQTQFSNSRLPITNTAPGASAGVTNPPITNSQSPISSLSLKSRMGLHTGEAELREGDYFGQTLNRAARIMSAGHGGQILISDVVAQGERAFGGGCFVG
ncbi:MAG: adenylate/guanylate cyclase domain-containing protein [Anaerolineales bacterium]